MNPSQKQATKTPSQGFLNLKRLKIDTHQEPVVYLRKDGEVCRSEGFEAQSRVRISTQTRSIIATLNIVDDGILSTGEAGLSESAWQLLAPQEGERAHLTHPETVDSLSRVRAKIFDSIVVVWIILFITTTALSKPSEQNFIPKPPSTAVRKSGEFYLQQAQAAYQKGDREKAQTLYTKAAQKGNAEAHFRLAYQYILSPEKSIYHFVEAAKKGHKEALGYALDRLFFRAKDLRQANPELALQVYQQAKQINPTLKLYDEDNKLKTIQKCVELGKFDVKAFIKKYKIETDPKGSPYQVWGLAEEASKGGRFGKPDPKLVLNLVCHGGWVPAELEAAVSETYDHWKNGKVKDFDICNYITSGYGGGFCALRTEDKNKKMNAAKLDELSAKFAFDEKTKTLLTNAYKITAKFAM